MTQETPAVLTASARVTSPAILRLTRSRSALRLVLQKGTDADASKVAPKLASENIFGSLLGMLKDQPTAQLLLTAAQGIWAKNPWMILGKNAFEASNILLTPVAQRSPVKLVAGAFVFGAVLCMLRPWKLLKRSALIASFFAR